MVAHSQLALTFYLDSLPGHGMVHTFLVDLPTSVNLIQMGPEAYLVHDSTSYDTDTNCCECLL